METTTLPSWDTGGTGGIGPHTSATVGDGTGDTSSDPASGDESGDACAEVQVMVNAVTPTVVVVVDQSSSMYDPFADGVDRWDATYAALMSSTDGVISKLEGQVRFGLSLYSSMNGNEGGSCPMLTEVPPALDNRDAIDDVYREQDPIDDTPTGDALELVIDDLAAVDFEGPKAIILATDGEPDTCAMHDPQNGQPQSIAAVQRAHTLGIETYIISVGAEVSDEHLREMANAGLGRDLDDPNQAPFYRANDPETLVSDLLQIVGGVVGCELTIEGEVDLDQKCAGTVTLDGQALQCGVDYDVTDSMTLELLGDACDTIRDGDEHEVSATFPCGAIYIP